MCVYALEELPLLKPTILKHSLDVIEKKKTQDKSL